MLALLLAEAELLPSPPLLLLDDVLSELDARRRDVLAGRASRLRAGRDHDDAPLALTRPSRSGRGGDPWTGSADSVRRELARFGPQAGLADLVARWPDAVGGGIARNAWPARIARDGTRRDPHLGLGLGVRARPRAAEIAGRLGVPASGSLPGPLPEPAELAPAPRPPEPTPEQAAEAAAIAASISDGELRESVQKALRLGLARGAHDRPV